MKRTTDRCVSLEMQCAMNQSGKNSPIAQRPAQTCHYAENARDE